MRNPGSIAFVAALVTNMTIRAFFVTYLLNPFKTNHSHTPMRGKKYPHPIRVMLLLISLIWFESGQFASGQETGILKPGTVTFEDPFNDLNLYTPSLESKFLSYVDIDKWYSNILLEDSKGFLWMAWQGSLVKYDGYQFKSFDKVPIGPDDLDAFRVQAMEEDEFGNLWLGCLRGQGLYRYNPRREFFERFPRNDNDPRRISESAIWSISADMNGSVWIATADWGTGLYRYDYPSDSFEVFRDEQGNPTALPCNYIDLVYADSQSNIWLNTNQSTRYERPGGFYHYNLKDNKFRQVLFIAPGIDQHGALADWILEDGEGNLWMTIEHLKDGEVVRWLVFMIPFPWEACVKEITDTTILFEGYRVYPGQWHYRGFDIDQQGHLWIGSNFGMFRMNPSTVRFDYYTSANFDHDIYPWFYQVLCTRSGMVWHGFNVGLSRYVPWKRKFTLYNAAFFEQKTDMQHEVHSIYEAEDGILWTGLKNRLVRYDPETRESRSYTPLDMQDAISSTLRNRNNPITCIQPGKDGELLVSGDNYLCIFDIKEESFELIDFPEEQWFNFGHVVGSHHLIMDRNGLLWIGVGPGCIRVDLQQKQAKYLYGLRDNRFLGGRTYTIVEDKQGMLWMGTGSGLTRYDPGTQKILNIICDPDRPRGLAARDVNSMIQDRNGNLWIGSMNHGISFLKGEQVLDPNLHPDSLEFSYLSLEDGLPDLRIHDLVEDLSGKIWIASRRGLSCYDPGTRIIRVYTETDGIDILPFSSKFHLNKRSGRIYIGGWNGMISFHPDSIPVNTYIPPVVITGFKLHDRPVAISDSTVLGQSITYTDKLDLSHEENFLEFTFAALDYTDPRNNQYKYYMAGVDRDTVYAGTDRTAVYRDMNPGKYTFWVTGSNNDGVWNPEGTSIEIRIHPPWYRSSTAFGSYILLFIFCVAGFIRLRTSRLEKEKRLLEIEVAARTSELRQKNEQIVGMEQLKTRFFTNVSHEIRTPLTLISGPLENLIQKHYPDADTHRWLGVIKRNSNRLLQLVNQLLDISRLDSGQMKLILEKGNVVKHLSILAQEYQSLAESKRIQFICSFPEQELDSWYDREKMEKVTNNLLSNAFKYTPDHGTVHFRVKTINAPQDEAGRQIRIMVADTGPGIPESEREKIFDRFYRSEEELHEKAAGTGIGLSLTKELVSMMKGEIYVRSSTGKGSLFIITIPVGKEHLHKSEYVEKAEEKVPSVEPLEPVAGEADDMQPELLVVEDNTELRAYIRDNLSDRFRITEAEDGIRGLETAFAHIPDLVISDVMMPGMDGVEMCGKLKSDERTSHIPVIILTAKSTRADRLEGLEQGADDYISKPFDIKELKVRIKNLLDQREKLRQKYSGMVGLDWNDLSVTTLDEKFLRKITAVVSEKMQDSDFNVNVLQEEMAMSRENLFRKLKALTGDTPSGLIRRMRLKTAAAMLEKGNENITRIALNTGFSNSSLFAQLFRKEYGMTPGEYRKSVQS